jgi:RNA polymerase sigma-70 factor (ECF subfamily)
MPLRTALADLADRPRALLRYHLIDGWTIDRIGERYGVHRATAARWLADAREQVGKLIRKELARRLAIPKSDVDSLVTMLTSGIDVSLERLLAGPSGS